MVYPVIHIAEHNIRPRTLSGVHHLHAQFCASDTPPDESRIKYHGLHKSVLGAPQCLILIRFLHASGRIGSGINQYAPVITIDKERKHPR